MIALTGTFTRGFSAWRTVHKSLAVDNQYVNKKEKTYHIFLCIMYHIYIYMYYIWYCTLIQRKVHWQLLLLILIEAFKWCPKMIIWLSYHRRIVCHSTNSKNQHGWKRWWLSPASQDRLNIPFQLFILCLFAPSWHAPDHEAQSLVQTWKVEKKTRAGNMAMSHTVQCPFQKETVKQRLSQFIIANYQQSINFPGPYLILRARTLFKKLTGRGPTYSRVAQ